MSSKFGFLSKLFTLSALEIKQSAANLVQAYPHDDLEPSIESELAQFSSLL